MSGGAADRFATAAQVTVVDLDTPELDDDADHHLRRVLRLRDGDEVTAVDGAGGWRNCRLAGGASLDPLMSSVVEPAPSGPLTVAFAPVKGDRPELVVQKLTELGVDRIVVFHAARSVVRWRGERGTRQLARLGRIARSACEQSRRLHHPHIGLEGVTGVPDLAALARDPDLAATSPVVADRGGEPLWSCDPVPRTVLIGPEGGWAPGELEGWRTAGLGETVLRAETAAIAAGVLLAARRTEVGGR